MHSNTIIRNRIANHIEADIIAKRFSEAENTADFRKLVYKHVVAKIEDQKRIMLVNSN